MFLLGDKKVERSTLRLKTGDGFSETGMSRQNWDTNEDKVNQERNESHLVSDWRGTEKEERVMRYVRRD